MRSFPVDLRALLPAAIALLAAVVVSTLVVLAAGADPVLAFSALIEGAFGSADGLSEVGVRTCPLLLTGLAVGLAFRAGVWNIGAEGQLLAGAAAMAWLGREPFGAPAVVGLSLTLVGAGIAGALCALAAAVLKQWRGVSEIISTIMLNFVVLGLVSYLVHGPLMETAGAYPQSDAVALEMRLPRLFSGFRAHVGIVIALAAAALQYVLLFRTVIGYEMRATGANANAARLAGIRTGRRAFLALVLSGALAGLAGGVEVSAVTYRLYERFSPGYGFTAIAVALLARLHPAGIVLAAALFGALQAGSSSMQRSAGISSVLVWVIQATVIFGVLAADYGSAGRARNPGGHRFVGAGGGEGPPPRPRGNDGALPSESMPPGGRRGNEGRSRRRGET